MRTDPSFDPPVRPSGPGDPADPELTNDVPIDTDRESAALDDAADPWTQTTTYARYRLRSSDEPLAAGGMGAIYQAHDTTLERDVALKQLLPEHADSVYWRMRFRQEAAINAYLDRNLGVIPVHDVGVWPDGRTYFTMPLIQPFMQPEEAEFAPAIKTEWRAFAVSIRNLHDSLRAGRLDADGQRGYLRRFVRSLKFAARTIHSVHRQGVVHLDLKPSNILLTEHPSACWVIDWGLAACLGDYDPKARTRSADRRHRRVDWDLWLPRRPVRDFRRTLGSQGFGTSAYTCPELARGEYDQIGVAADVFCLGAILYAILHGRPPYLAPTVAETLDLARRGDFPDAPRPFHAGLADRTDSLLEVCRTAMRRDPAGRYGSADEFAQQLKTR